LAEGARIVECVPNFSEGRRPEVVESIATAVGSVAGAALLDTSADGDHNRCVLTVVGDPEAVAEAAFRGVRTAVDLIDMEKHQGGHPRIGAADVVPFIPVRGIDVAGCVGLARRLGERIAGELKVPVYFYGEAAAVPERRNLKDIRKGQYEALKSEVERPGREPDLGPRRLHPTAGATIVGVRKPLLAYNIDLSSTDKSLADAIARKVRTSSGGLPNVMAAGIEMSGRKRVQVSMNLTDTDVTPVHVAYEAVRGEAEARGVEVAESEVIGLVTLEALLDAVRHYLRLPGLKAEQVLEARLLDLLLQKEARRDDDGS
jgi:glutamate formiminotransferase